METNKLFTVKDEHLVEMTQLDLLNILNEGLDKEKNPEEQLRLFLLHNLNLIIDAINMSLGKPIKENEIFPIREFSSFSISDGIRIDILLLTVEGDIVIFELKILKNINKINSIFNQVTDYMDTILKKSSDEILEALSRNKYNSCDFDEFIQKNELDIDEFKDNISTCILEKKIKSIIVFDKLNEKIINKFEKNEVFKSFIKSNIFLMQIHAYKNEKNEVFYQLYMAKNISIKIDANLNKTLKIYNNLQLRIQRSLEELQKQIEQLQRYKLVDNYQHTCINSGETSPFKDKINSLIMREISRLKPTTFSNLFELEGLDSQIPSRSECYKIFDEDEIARFRNVIKSINSDLEEDKKDMIINSIRNFYYKYGYSPTTKQCNNIIGIHFNTVKKYFGTYNNAIREALKEELVKDPNCKVFEHNPKLTEEETIDEIIKISKSVKKLTVAQFKNKGAHYHLYIEYFKGFNQALKAAGIDKDNWSPSI